MVVGRRMLRLGMGSEAGAGTPMSIMSGLRGGGEEEEEGGTRIRSARPREGGRGRSVRGWRGTVVGGFWGGFGVEVERFEEVCCGWCWLMGIWEGRRGCGNPLGVSGWVV